MAQRRANRHPRLRRASIIVAAGLVLLLTLGTAAYVKLNSNITKYDVSKLLGQRIRRPQVGSGGQRPP